MRPDVSPPSGSSPDHPPRVAHPRARRALTRHLGPKPLIWFLTCPPLARYQAPPHRQSDSADPALCATGTHRAVGRAPLRNPAPLPDRSSPGPAHTPTPDRCSPCCRTCSDQQGHSMPAPAHPRRCNPRGSARADRVPLQRPGYCTVHERPRRASPPPRHPPQRAAASGASPIRAQ